MEDEATYLAQLLQRYRWLLSQVSDEKATHAIESLIREAEARLDEILGEQSPPQPPRRQVNGQ